MDGEGLVNGVRGGEGTARDIQMEALGWLPPTSALPVLCFRVATECHTPHRSFHYTLTLSPEESITGSISPMNKGRLREVQRPAQSLVAGVAEAGLQPGLTGALNHDISPLPPWFMSTGSNPGEQCQLRASAQWEFDKAAGMMGSLGKLSLVAPPALATTSRTWENALPLASGNY